MGRETIARRRLWVLVVAMVLCAAASVSLVTGILYQGAAARMAATLAEVGPHTTMCIGKMREQVMEFAVSDSGGSAARLSEWIEECGEGLAVFRGAFKRALGAEPSYAAMTEEWDEIATKGKRISLAGRPAGAEPLQPEEWHTVVHEIGVDLDAFDGHYSSAHAGAVAAMARRRFTGSWYLYAGLAGAVGSCLCCFVLVLSTLSDVLSDSFELRDLGKELEGLAGDPQFLARINLLREGAAPPKKGAVWELSLGRCVGERRTHVCFEATARCGDEEILLWGRRYKWAGYVKSLTRLFFPAYENAYWGALCALQANGLPGPVPVVHARFLKGAFHRGGMILMEHLGELEGLKPFTRTGFCLLSPDAQRELLRRLIRFVESLHSAGLYSIMLRYIHAKNLDDPQGRAQFCVLDLDKVFLWESCPGFIAALLRGVDFRRLARDLKRNLSRPMFAELKERLAGRR